jgi:voltage-gated potassium channel Kch
MHLLAGILAIIVIGGTLLELFETMVLPRRVTRRLRVTRLIYLIWIPWQRLARLFPKRREAILSVFGPFAILLLLIVWALGIVAGFALLQWAGGSSLRAGSQTDLSFGDSLYFSASTFLTLGLGDIVPRGGVARALAMLEAGGGFGVLALVIGYLPALYQAFARRETAVSLLDARAGSPPSAYELVRRYAQDDDWDGLISYLQEWEAWVADQMESHLSYPMISYFRSQHDNQSWLAAITTILDTCALIVAGFPDVRHRPAKLTYALGRHFVVDLSQVLRAPPVTLDVERLPASDLARLRDGLAQTGVTVADEEAMARLLSVFRDNYEPYVMALSRRLSLPLPDWISPGEVTEDWRSTAWDPTSRLLF